LFVCLPEGNSVAQELEEERRWEMNLEGLEEGLCDEVRGMLGAMMPWRRWWNLKCTICSM